MTITWLNLSGACRDIILVLFYLKGNAFHLRMFMYCVLAQEDQWSHLSHSTGVIKFYTYIVYSLCVSVCTCFSLLLLHLQGSRIVCLCTSCSQAGRKRKVLLESAQVWVSHTAGELKWARELENGLFHSWGLGGEKSSSRLHRCCLLLWSEWALCS